MNVDFYLVSADRRARRLMIKRSYVVGRDPGADISIQDALMSRRHAEFRWMGDHWLLIDCNSRNGVLVNGQRVVGSHRLQDGDRVQFGGQVLSYYMLPTGSDLGTVSQQAPEISAQVTMAPGVNLSAMANANAAFSGAITNGLLELVQFFTMTRKHGRLDLTDHPGSSIWFVDGVPRDATLKGQQGFDALLMMVKNPGGNFAFFADDPPPRGPQIPGSSDGILMELARNMDEGQR